MLSSGEDFVWTQANESLTRCFPPEKPVLCGELFVSGVCRERVLCQCLRSVVATATVPPHFSEPFMLHWLLSLYLVLGLSQGDVGRDHA